jgi:hypothetical protein
VTVNTNTTIPPSGMAIEVGKVQVKSGETVRVPITLRNSGNVANMNYQVRYNAGIVRPESDAAKGPMLSNAYQSSNIKDSGLIRVGFSQTTGLQGTGVVAELVFRAIGAAGTRTDLPIEVTAINDPGGATLNIDKIPGSIEIFPDVKPPADCDGDGRLTANDALCALQMSVGLIPVNLQVDMDKNGQVTSRDATIILLRALGKQ